MRHDPEGIKGGLISSAQEIIKRLGLTPEEIEILLDELPDLRASAPRNRAQARESILKRWSIDEEILTELIDGVPSLRGMLFGYVAEYHFTRLWLRRPDVTYTVKPDDHNRKKKGDRIIIYKGRELSIEVKSLQSAMTVAKSDGTFLGKAQCDGSDRRIVTFADGTQLNTTCLLAGEFDVLAVNCFGFRGVWEFAFAANDDLPRSNHKKYTDAQRAALLATLVPVSWPPKPPFAENPFTVFDGILKRRVK